MSYDDIIFNTRIINKDYECVCKSKSGIKDYFGQQPPTLPKRNVKKNTGNTGNIENIYEKPVAQQPIYEMPEPLYQSIDSPHIYASIESPLGRGRKSKGTKSKSRSRGRSKVRYNIGDPSPDANIGGARKTYKRKRTHKKKKKTRRLRRTRK